MNKDKLKAEASRKRWSKIPNPQSFFKPLKMAEHKFEKAESEDPIGIKLRQEFGVLEEFVKHTDDKLLQHDQNHDYFASVDPKHCPIHLQPPHNSNNNRHPSQAKPKEGIDAKNLTNRRSQNPDHQLNKQPPINHVKPTPATGDVQTINSDLKKGKPLESKKRSSESDSWKNNFNFSSPAEVNLKVTKFSEEVSLPALLSPLLQKTIPSPPKIMTKIQQIELSENPLDFSVSEDEMNAEEDRSESPGPASIDDTKENDRASDGKDEAMKLSPPVNEFSHSSQPLMMEVSVEEGEIIENDFLRGNFRSSSKVRSSTDTAPHANSNISKNIRRNGSINKNFLELKTFDNFMDVESQNEREVTADDLEEGEIEEDKVGKPTLIGSLSSRSSSDSYSDDSSNVSEPSPVHSKHGDPDVGVIEYQMNPNDKRVIKNYDDVSKERTTAFVNHVPVEEARDQSSVNAVEKNSQNLGFSKSSAFELPMKKHPIPVQPKTCPEPQKEKLKVEKTKTEELHRESPVRIPTPADKKEPANNLLAQRPKQGPPTCPKMDGKDVKLKIKNVNGSFKANDDIGKLKTVDQGASMTKPTEKKDKKPDAMPNKKQLGMKSADNANNLQGFNSALQSSKVVKKHVAKENPTNNKNEARVDVKSRKRKSDDPEKESERMSGILPKIPKLVPNTKLPEVPLVLRFNLDLFSRLEKMEKKRKPEDEVSSQLKKPRIESDPNLKDSSLKKTKIKKTVTEKPNLEHDQSTLKKSKKMKQNHELGTPSASIDDKKNRLQESHKEYDNPPGDSQPAKKPVKKMSKPNREEILKKANEALLKGKDKTFDQVNNQQFLSVPGNESMATIKSNSPVEKNKKEGPKNLPKHTNGTTPGKVEQHIFMGTLKVAPLSTDSNLHPTNDAEEKQAIVNINQSHVETIRRKGISHQNNSQFLQTMAKVFQDKNGGVINFGYLLNSIESHVLGFLGTVELAKINEDSLNIRHYNQLISNLEVSIKELDGSAERNRLNFLLHSFAAMVNDYYFNFTFNKDKLLNETAVREIQATDSKNSPRSSPDSTCTNPSTINQDPNASQQVVGNDALAIKSLNQAKINLSFLFPYLYNCNSHLKVLFKLALEPSCQDLCDRRHLPVDIIHADLQAWSRWFEDAMTRLRATYQLQCPPLHPNISSAL